MIYSAGLYILIECLITVLAQSGTLQCPVSWTVGSTVTLTLSIDDTVFPSACTRGTSGQPKFERSYPSPGSQTTNCTVPDIRTDCSFSSDTLGCGCVLHSGGFYRMEYRFIAHPDYDGWWTASLACVDESFNQVITITTSNCDNKTVTAPTIAVGDDGLSGGEIAGIVVGIGIAVIIVVVLVVLIRCKKFTRTITVPTNVDVTQADVNAINNNTVADVNMSTNRREIIITGTICEVNEAAKQVEQLIENNYVATISFSLHVDVTDNQLNGIRRETGVQTTQSRNNKEQEITMRGTQAQVQQAKERVEKLIETNYVATISFSLHVDVTDNQLNGIKRETGAQTAQSRNDKEQEITMRGTEAQVQQAKERVEALITRLKN